MATSQAQARGVRVSSNPPLNAANVSDPTPRPRANTRRMPTLRERQQLQQQHGSGSNFDSNSGVGLNNPIMYDEGSSGPKSTLAKFAARRGARFFNRGGDTNDPLVGMVKPLLMAKAGGTDGDSDLEDSVVDYSQYSNPDDAEAARVSRLRDMEGLFHIKIKETAKSGADVSTSVDAADNEGAGKGDKNGGGSGQKTSLTRMLDDLGRQQSKADRYGWRLRYMRLTNNLTAGGGSRMWAPGSGPPPSLGRARPVATPRTATGESDVIQNYFSPPPPGHPQSATASPSPELNPNKSAAVVPPSPIVGPLSVGSHTPTPTPSALRSPTNSIAPPPLPLPNHPTVHVSADPPQGQGGGVRNTKPTSPTSSPDLRLVRRGSGYFDGFVGKSVVDVDAAVLEVYHVDVDNANKTFTIRSKAMAIPLKCMTLVRRGKLEQNRALEFPADTPSGKEYKFGHLRLEVLFDMEIGSGSGTGAKSPRSSSASGQSQPPAATHTGLFRGGPGSAQHRTANGNPTVSGRKSGSANSRSSSPSSSKGKKLSISSLSPFGGGATNGNSNSAKKTIHHELEIITGTAKERDLWYDWISSFILHADLVDLHTDKDRERVVPQYDLQRPTKDVNGFIDLFLSGKRKVDVLNNMIGGAISLGGAIGAGFKPLMLNMSSGIVKPPRQGEIFLLTPYGPRPEQRCRVTCPKLGECMLTPLDTDDCDRVLIPLSHVEITVHDPLETSLFLTFTNAIHAAAFVRQCAEIIDAMDPEEEDEDDDYFLGGGERDGEDGDGSPEGGSLFGLDEDGFDIIRFGVRSGNRRGPRRDPATGMLRIMRFEFRMESCYERDQMAEWFVKVSDRNLSKSAPFVYEREVDPTKDRFTFTSARQAEELKNKESMGIDTDAADSSKTMAAGSANQRVPATRSNSPPSPHLSKGLLMPNSTSREGNTAARNNPLNLSSSADGAAMAIRLHSTQSTDMTIGGPAGATLSSLSTAQPLGGDDLLSLVRTIPKCFYRKKKRHSAPQQRGGVVLTPHVLKATGPLAALLENPFLSSFVSAALPMVAPGGQPYPEGSRFVPSDLLDVLVVPLSAWAMVGYTEIGHIPPAEGGGSGAFARRAVTIDFPSRTIFILEGPELEEVCVRLDFSDVTCVTAYSKAFGSCGFTLHCLENGVEVVVMLLEEPIDEASKDHNMLRLGDSGTTLMSFLSGAALISGEKYSRGHSISMKASDPIRWLDAFDLAGCDVKSDETREDVNNRYLRELNEERARVDAINGIDLCDNNVATLLPCSLCGKQSYVCDATGTFHPDAIDRLATINAQQELQRKKAVLQELEDDFATSSSSSSSSEGEEEETDEENNFENDPLLGTPKRRQSGKKRLLGKDGRKNKSATSLTSQPPALASWVLASMPPEVRTVPANDESFYEKVIAQANSVANAAERSLRRYHSVFLPQPSRSVNQQQQNVSFLAPTDNVSSTSVHISASPAATNDNANKTILGKSLLLSTTSGMEPSGQQQNSRQEQIEAVSASLQKQASLQPSVPTTAKVFGATTRHHLSYSLPEIVKTYAVDLSM